MRFPVPQFINVEDKVAGPLTWTQLYWMIALGAVDLILWRTLPFGYFIVIGLPVTAMFVALAFWRPYGQPLIKTVWHAFVFVFRPKTYFWQRVPENQKQSSPPPEKPKPVERKSYEETLGEIRNYADLLDNPDEGKISGEVSFDEKRGVWSKIRGLFGGGKQ